MSWIKCINEMPSQGQRIIVFSDHVSTAHYWIHEPGVHDADTCFYDELDGEIFPVTHWMPLPESPK